MQLKNIFITLFIFFTVTQTYAKTDFLLKPDDTTSFMNYEYHSLALEAAEKNNYEEAFRLYQKVAQKDDDKAEYNIGMMYMKGLGVKKSKMDAYKWLRRASKHGNKEATLFFKEMNERYAKNLKKKEELQAKKALDAVKQKRDEPEANKTIEKNSTVLALSKLTKPKKVKTLEAVSQQSNESNTVFYIIVTIVVLALVLGLFLALKLSRKPKEESTPQNSLKNRAQIFDTTYSLISNYHSELLKIFNLDKYRNDKRKMQMYYMFIGGMIDYFCQLEKFNEMEERRIFTTHIASVEGKENVTAITQAILEGQRDTSLYHAQAAGGISAKQWHETGSTKAFMMLKKVLEEKRD